jgi:hypothetical protein
MFILKISRPSQLHFRAAYDPLADPTRENIPVSGTWNPLNPVCGQK